MKFIFTKYSQDEIAEIVRSIKKTKEKKSKDEKLIPKAKQKLQEVSKYMYVFEGMENEEILQVVKNAELIEVKKDHSSKLAEDCSDSICFLIKGKLAVYYNGEYIEEIKALDTFAENSFVLKKPLKEDIKAITDVAVVLKVSINEEADCCLLNMIYANIAYRVMQKYEKKVKSVIKL